MSASVNTSRDLSAARNAFNHLDAEMSRRAHEVKKQSQVCEDGHQTGHNTYQRITVNNAIHGLTLTLVVVWSMAFFHERSLTVGLRPWNGGNGVTVEVDDEGAVWGVAFAFSVGGAVVFAASEVFNFLFSKQHFGRERQRESWELRNFPRGEQEEMVELYVARGMTLADARLTISTMAKYEDFFVDVMMMEELGMVPPDDLARPSLIGLVSFLAFFSGGALVAMLVPCLLPLAGSVLDACAPLLPPFMTAESALLRLALASLALCPAAFVLSVMRGDLFGFVGVRRLVAGAEGVVMLCGAVTAAVLAALLLRAALAAEHQVALGGGGGGVGGVGVVGEL